MKQKQTMTEIGIQMAEDLRRAELKYWQMKHPDAKVTYDKKRHEIWITYPLPRDLVLMEKFIKNL